MYYLLLSNLFYDARLLFITIIVIHLSSSNPFFISFTEYGIYLTEIALDKNITWPVRQLASVLLKQFVNAHWSKNREKCSELELSPTDKAKIRDLLISGKLSVLIFQKRIPCEPSLSYPLSTQT